MVKGAIGVADGTHGFALRKETRPAGIPQCAEPGIRPISGRVQRRISGSMANSVFCKSSVVFGSEVRKRDHHPGFMRTSNPPCKMPLAVIRTAHREPARHRLDKRDGLVFGRRETVSGRGAAMSDDAVPRSKDMRQNA